MSIGHGAKASLIGSDASGVLYSYSCYDINQKGWEQIHDTEDGEIWIAKEALVEPEIHEKLKRLPSGRKKTIIKRIPRPVPFSELIEAGKIQIKNASGTWETEGSTDTIKRNNWIIRAFNGILNTILMGGDDFGSVYSLQR